MSPWLKPAVKVLQSANAKLPMQWGDGLVAVS
jgi:hypothetical protein